MMVHREGKSLFTRHRILLFAELMIVLFCCYFPLCYRIDANTIRVWDEARNAANAIEMLQNNNYLVRHIFGSPETWETKPPLLIWLQVSSLKVFGLNEFAIRFPTMVATFLTVLLLIYFFHRHFGNRYIGYIASLVLVTSQGYIDRHIARTGDHDALLVLFLTAICLYFYLYITTGKKRPAFLICLALLFIAAIFTKSMAAFFILPGLLISVFVFKAGHKVFINKWLYVSFVMAIVVVGSYYVVREQMQPGYLGYVWKEELFPRYSDTVNYSYGTFWYYAINLYTERFTYWLFFLIPAIVVLPFVLKGYTRKMFWYLIILIVTVFLIISAGTKNLWYDAVLYPMFSILIAFMMLKIFDFAEKRVPIINPSLLRPILLIAFFAYPSVKIIQKVSNVEEYPWDKDIYATGYVLRNQEMMHKLPMPMKIIFHGYNVHLYFYTEVLMIENGSEQVTLSHINDIRSGDAVMLSQQTVMDSIQGKFTYEVIMEKPPVKVLRITEQIPDLH